MKDLNLKQTLTILKDFTTKKYGATDFIYYNKKEHSLVATDKFRLVRIELSDDINIADEDSFIDVNKQFDNYDIKTSKTIEGFKIETAEKCELYYPEVNRLLRRDLTKYNGDLELQDLILNIGVEMRKHILVGYSDCYKKLSKIYLNQVEVYAEDDSPFMIEGWMRNLRNCKFKILVMPLNI